VASALECQRLVKIPTNERHSGLFALFRSTCYTEPATKFCARVLFQLPRHAPDPQFFSLTLLICSLLRCLYSLVGGACSFSSFPVFSASFSCSASPAYPQRVLFAGEGSN
jgi:hypothetical protein